MLEICDESDRIRDRARHVVLFIGSLRRVQALCCGVLSSAMSCLGESFNPDGLYESCWYRVEPRTGKHQANNMELQSDVESLAAMLPLSASPPSDDPNRYTAPDSTRCVPVVLAET